MYTDTEGTTEPPPREARLCPLALGSRRGVGSHHRARQTTTTTPLLPSRGASGPRSASPCGCGQKTPHRSACSLFVAARFLPPTRSALLTRVLEGQMELWEVSVHRYSAQSRRRVGQMCWVLGFFLACVMFASSLFHVAPKRRYHGVRKVRRFQPKKNPKKKNQKKEKKK